MIGGLKRVLSVLASLRLTLACLVLAAAIVLVAELADSNVGWAVAVPFGFLCLNLLAALLATPKLRRQGGLLVFHLSLALLALLVAADRLMSLNGHVEVTEGTAFDPGLVEAQAGPLHPWALDSVRFTQAEFVIDYAPAVKRRETFSNVRVWQGPGRWRDLVIGDDRPLIAGNYRFYTSFNKGFAPVLTYVDERGKAHSGAVHLPSYPLNYFKQGNDWPIPASKRSVKLWLHLPEPVFDETASWHFRKPENATLILIDGQMRYELRPGETIPIGRGSLRYEALRSWMGYTISYNPLIPWMLATAAVGLACLGWHVGRRFQRTPWQKLGDMGEAGHG